MDTHIIFPILGVVIGWLLNELGYYFRTTRENRRSLNEAVFILLDFQAFLTHVRDILIGTQSIDEFHLTTVKLINLLTDDEDILSIGFRKNLQIAFSNISKFDPFLAQQLRSSSSILNNFKDGILSDGPRPHLHKLTIEAQAKLIEVHLQLLDKLIRNLLVRFAFFKWLKYRIESKKMKKPNNIWPDYFKAIDETYHSLGA